MIDSKEDMINALGQANREIDKLERKLQLVIDHFINTKKKYIHFKESEDGNIIGVEVKDKNPILSLSDDFYTESNHNIESKCIFSVPMDYEKLISYIDKDIYTIRVQTSNNRITTYKCISIIHKTVKDFLEHPEKYKTGSKFFFQLIEINGIHCYAILQNIVKKSDDKSDDNHKYINFEMDGEKFISYDAYVAKNRLTLLENKIKECGWNIVYIKDPNGFKEVGVRLVGQQNRNFIKLDIDSMNTELEEAVNKVNKISDICKGE